MTPEPEVMPCKVARIETPDGTMFVTISHSAAGEPLRVDVTIGKAGAALAAWAYAVSGLITLALRKDATLVEVLYALAGLSSDKQATRLFDKAIVKSGPDGIAKALILYMMGG